MVFVETNWYWVVGDTNPTTQVYSTASGGYVANNAAAFLTWLADKNLGAASGYASGQIITSAANNGAGKTRLTVGTTSQMQTGQFLNVGANGNQQITVIDGTHLDLLNLNFSSYVATKYIYGASVLPTNASLMSYLHSPPSHAPLGLGRVGSLNAVNVGGTSTTQMSISVGACVFRDFFGQSLLDTTGASNVVVDITVAGPAVNGRDQAAAFVAGNAVHFFAIRGPGTGVNFTVSLSATAPAALPSGYTHYCFLFSVVLAAGPGLPVVLVQGDYIAFNSPAPTVLSGGTSTTPVQVSYASFVPPNATNVFMVLIARAVSATYSLFTGPDVNLTGPSVGSTLVGLDAYLGDIYSNKQSIYYENSVANQSSFLALNGYWVSNGT